MRSVLKLCAFSLLCLLAACAWAQSAPEPPAAAGAAVPDPAPPPLPPPNAKVFRMRSEAMDAEPVKGAPFCATVVTEHTQAFADGNRIHTSDSSRLCRDARGRIRREAGLNLLEAGPEGAPPKLITIVDPVAGYRYLLDSETKVAHRFPVGSADRAGANAAAKGQVVMYQSVGVGGPEMSLGRDVFFKGARAASPDETPESSEDLGVEEIEGIRAAGTRVTTTIPAGKMGNEQPMTITSERWYSPDLKATVMTKHTDPWAGELATQFKEVSRAAPDPSLFAVPGDYRIVDEKNGPFVIQKRILAPPPRP